MDLTLFGTVIVQRRTSDKDETKKKKKKKNRMDSMECFWSGMISDGRSSLVDRDDDHDHQKQK